RVIHESRYKRITPVEDPQGARARIHFPAALGHRRQNWWVGTPTARYLERLLFDGEVMKVFRV
ncbi:MAG: hypothetical protein PVF51_11185, partial [Nitrospirota bacterium]